MLSEVRKTCQKLLADEKKIIETKFNEVMKDEIAKIMAELSLLQPLNETVLKSSAILKTDSQRKFVRSMFKDGLLCCQVTRLYQATDHGFTADKFHSLCDNKGPTLTLIKTVAGHTFGGFTTVSWDKSINYK